MGSGSILYSTIGAENGVVAIILVITAVVSAIQCFFGYKIFKFWIGVMGFIVFGFLGAVIGALAFKGSVGGAIILGLICGVLGAFLAMKVYKLGVFIQCFSTGVIVGLVLSAVMSVSEEGTLIALSSILGIIFGIIGVVLIKPVIIISTSFFGGMVLGFSLVGLFKGNMIIVVLLGLICSVAGVVYQFYTNKDPKKVANTNNTNNANSVNNASSGNIPLSNENNNVQAVAIGVPTPSSNVSVATDSSQSTNGDVETAVSSTTNEGKTNEFVEDAKKKMDDMKSELQKKIQHKIETDSKEISEEDSRASALYMFKGVESFVYSNKIVKTIMPFIEYVLYIITGIFFLRGLFIRSISFMSMTSTIVLGIVILLCLVKGKKIGVIISLAIIGVSQFIGITRLDALRYLDARFTFKYFLEVVIILGFAALVAYFTFSKKTVTKEEAIDK
ncbi:MAG: DUF4203 domain-containing protein [Tissierellales bacterium]